MISKEPSNIATTTVQSKISIEDYNKLVEQSNDLTTTKSAYIRVLIESHFDLLNHDDFPEDVSDIIDVIEEFLTSLTSLTDNNIYIYEDSVKLVSLLLQKQRDLFLEFERISRLNGYIANITKSRANR